MLTIFGKKKKDDSSLGLDTGTDNQTSPPPYTPPQSMQPQPPPPIIPQDQPASQSTQSLVNNQPFTPPTPPSARMTTSGPLPRQLPLDFSFPSEETSLSRILQSLLQDIPTNTGSSFSPMRESTPEYVAPRATPPSRAMVIGQKDDEGGWEEQGKSSTSKQPPVIPSAPIIKADYVPGAQVPAGKTTTTSPVPQITIPPIPQKRDQPAEKPPDKPTKADKPTEKPAKEITPKKPARPPQNFDHIFELTQGNLESPGFVIINGPPGAGKTTLCSGLTANYLKKGDPCLYVTYDQAPTTLREQMKKLGSDPSQYESQYRFIIVDGYTSQSDSFSMEATYLDQPFNFENIQDTLVRNSQVFTGEKIRVIFDSIDKLATKVPQKDFVKRFTELAGKLKDSGATLIVTVDMSQLPKDLGGSLTDMADCVADLSKDDSDPNERELKIQRLNQKSAKIDAETFEIDSTKGLVFV
ncbi:MAG TPA: ATPase domain-containing protein [Candidatus Bathyarchaeia archaeon]|nr:ATPase domain-containing protein [Candidatus Bathyarchaeia archaeon]